MTENDRVMELDLAILDAFGKSKAKSYELWKRKSLLTIALETMPKQVKAEDVIDNLIMLKADFMRRFESDY